MTSLLQAELLSRVSSLRPEMAARAPALDHAAAFPAEDFATLHDAGLLTATLPPEHGGAGFGAGAGGAQALLKLLAILGAENLALARLFEAHVNALHLVLRYGTQNQIETVARDTASGHIFGLWVTDPLVGGGTHLEGCILQGRKVFCSGAGALSRALITAKTPAGTQMLLVEIVPGARVLHSRGKLSGMRASVTGAIEFSDMQVAPWRLLGAEGDYLREPLFSAGAWRNAAVALGGMMALAKLLREELRERQRDGDAHQRARFGRLVMQVETARLWMQQAAHLACVEDGPGDAIVAHVNLARLAVEASCLEAMQLTQRSLGIAAFMEGHPAERICRDLATFLRQPAPDEAMDKAAGYFLSHGLPGWLA
jgi:alkylation response protein AidB-like acyl-CoA dehydrogenase